MANNSGTGESESKHRWQLAQIVTVMSIVGIAIIGALVIILGDDKSQASQIVMTATLPLLASWVGAVLAYYYSSESIEAATRSVKELLTTQEKLQAIPVVDVMIKYRKMVYFTYEDSLNVQEMLQKLKDSGKGNRMPILGDEKQPVYILHKSAIDEALLKRAQAGDDLASVTLKDLLDKDPELKSLGESTFGVVGSNARLADAQYEMRRIDKCQDVFVTENGQRDDAVVGWITNGIIEEHSRV